MTMSPIEIERQASRLSPGDRARLAGYLLESLHDLVLAEVELDWKKEIARRVATHETNTAPAFSAEDVFAEAKRICQ
ncbi:MAG TPA: addiction module antitoxin RelB [Desulfobulbaceae bacterium]|nr:MAG: hypothetical protein A2520_04245 [Deltaproteobacteria bacterium RIFOXYD12_FULL_53_23]HCC53700.1 addiction module antitoxin RelB [Desulfobulbaceae bacterium]